MPPSEGHVKDATDHKYDFLRPIALMCISLPNSQSLVHWFRLWFYTTARCNLSSCKTAKEKINFSLDRGLPLQQGFYIEVWIRSHKPLWQIENVNMLESIMCLEQLHKTQENLSFFVNFFSPCVLVEKYFPQPTVTRTTPHQVQALSIPLFNSGKIMLTFLSVNETSQDLKATIVWVKKSAEN